MALEPSPTAASPALSASDSRGEEKPAPQSVSAGRRFLRWTIGIAITVFVLAGIGVWNAHRVTDEALASHLARAKREQSDLIARARGRPALLEPATAGD